MERTNKKVTTRLQSSRQELRRTARQTILDTRRNLNPIAPPPRTRKNVAEEQLKQWQAKKRKAQEEARKRPAFNNYVRAKHTGTTPYRKPVSPKKRPITSRLPPFGLRPTTSNAKTLPQRDNFQVPPSVAALLTTATFRQPVPQPKRPTQREKLLKQNVKPEVIPKVNVTRRVLKPRQLPQPSVVPARNPVELSNGSAGISKTTRGRAPVKPKVQINNVPSTAGGSRPNLRSAPKSQPQVARTAHVRTSAGLFKCQLPPNTTKPKSDPATKKGPSAPAPVRTPIPQSAPSGPLTPTRQRNRLEQESDDLLKAAKYWENIKESVRVPEWVKDDIDSVVGQIRLLVSSKFKQFRSLIDKAESGDPKILIDDLEGFWEMIYLNVVKLQESLDKLEKVQLNNWKSLDQPRADVKKRGTPHVKKPQKNVESRFAQFLKTRNKSVNGDSSTVNDTLSMIRVNAVRAESPADRVRRARASRPRSSINSVLHASFTGRTYS